jgi:23S rRNA (cytosine1962-C5)-methyltransferase
MNKLPVKSAGAARLRRGHPWVFSNEVLGRVPDLEPGEIVEVVDGQDCYLGTAYVNRHSLILARILSRRREPIDRRFFVQRIARALALRTQLYPGSTSYRLIYGEGDGLPGLVVDRYGDALVVQAHTLGMDLRLEQIVDSLEEVLHPEIVVERNDLPVRSLEGLSPRKGILRGSLHDPVFVKEKDVRFEIDLLEGQKTGFFFDHRESRAAFANLAGEGEVLDLFCYAGAWGLIAAMAGAKRVTFVDNSTHAMTLAQRNARLNGLSGKCEFLKDEALDAMRDLDRRDRRFDAIVLDPPAFVKSKKHLAEGLRGYRNLNARAIGFLPDGGILASSSCSYHVSWDLFEGVIADAVGRGRRRATVLYRGGQPPDHPVPLLLPEAAYLKCMIMRIEDA